MQDRKYLVEINLISNRLLEYAPNPARHPFPEYLRFGIPVCLNTDDPGAWDSNITDEYFSGVDMRQIVQWFDLGGEIQVTDSAAAKEVLEGVKGIQGLMEKLSVLSVSSKDNVESQVSAAEFILEGLHAHKRIGRSEERVFTAGEKQPKKPEQRTFEREEPFRGRRPFN